MVFKELKDDVITEKGEHSFTNIDNLVETLEKTIQKKDSTVLDLEKNIHELRVNIREKDEHITILENNIESKNLKINSLNRIISEMKGSNSWRVTKPLRNFTFLLKRLKNRNSTPQKQKTSNTQTKINFNEKSDPLFETFYFENPNSNSKCYVKKSNRYYKREEDDPKLISFYLPQFHTVKENDEWWGKGFTEWSNVTRAVPQIKGQYQPHLPDELGFYDLSNTDTFYKQIDLAKKYGIYGFCFHYYWFSGKRLLEKPIFNYLNDKNLDFPFMLCWANEPWTRAWDGSEREVLMPQNFGEEDYVKFIEDIMPFFKDERYIKINNSPMLIVYRPQYFPKEAMNAAIEIWRDYVKQNGFNDLYLINAESHDFDSDNKYENFDASVQFFSYKMAKNWRKDKNAVALNPEFTGLVFDYESFAKEKTYLQDFDYTLYRTVLPSWDNTARTMSNAMIFNNSSPELYKEWLENTVKYTKQKHSKDNQFVFLHSWNEWAEGAHLEPDRKYGFAYLEATLDVLEKQKFSSLK
jgi:O-antigen biosynthesis protein